MKLRSVLFLATVITLSALAQNKSNVEQRTPVVKNESGWNKDNDTPQANNQQTISDGITLSTRQNGISIIMPKAVANVKLFSLTGELVWAGNLVQGRFFIPTQAGIYFLRVNNKSYKVVCK